ncbi:hypothetical protein [Aquabacterium sp.]|uniref:hypothetical protein n=1 Tax=Aquabacterium sp. TaxID=1872578 RepID=UPI0035B36170
MCIARLAPFTLAPLALTLVAGLAHATAPHATVTIDDGVGDVYNLSLSSLLTTTADGAVLMKSLPATGSVIGSDSYGEWMSDTLNGKAAVTWHSWQTVNGQGQSAFDAATNPWASKFTFYASGHGDPDMTYGFVAKNNTNATQNYSFSYGEDIDPVYSGAYQLTATFGGSLSNTDGSATVSPLTVGGKIQKLELSTDGVNFYNAGADAGNALSASAAGTITGSDSASATGNAATPLTSWRFATTFSLTSKKDVFSFTGTASLVPEPENRLMLLAGLGVFGLLVARQRRDN